MGMSCSCAKCVSHQKAPQRQHSLRPGTARYIFKLLHYDPGMIYLSCFVLLRRFRARWMCSPECNFMCKAHERLGSTVCTKSFCHFVTNPCLRIFLIGRPQQTGDAEYEGPPLHTTNVACSCTDSVWQHVDCIFYTARLPTVRILTPRRTEDILPS